MHGVQRDWCDVCGTVLAFPNSAAYAAEKLRLRRAGLLKLAGAVPALLIGVSLVVLVPFLPLAFSLIPWFAGIFAGPILIAATLVILQALRSFQSAWLMLRFR
jgi:hypothetical protein